MADALPELDSHVSFVVDGNEATGPMALREIVRSIASGERERNSLVWWDGASEWRLFDGHPDLVELLEESRSSDDSDPLIQPPIEIVQPTSSVSPAVVASPPSLSGLFSASAREVNGLSEERSVPRQSAVEAVMSARSALATTDSISQARHNTLAAALSGPAALSEDLEALTEEAQAQGANGPGGGGPIAASQPAPSKHEEHFEELVKKSEEHQRRLEWATRVDELLLSGCIAAIGERGYLTRDLASRESEHRVQFETDKDTRFIILEIVPLPQTNAAGETIGRHLKVKMSWGQDVSDVESAFAVVRSLASDEERKPGKVRAEIDTTTSRVLTTVDLIWAADDFVSADYDVDSDALDDAVSAALHILERRWYKLFIRRR